MSGGVAKTLGDVIRRALEMHAADLHVSLPAEVVRFDAAKGLADVRPLVKDSREIDGERMLLPFPVITNVPVQFPGAGGFRVTFPVAAGDACVLLFSDRSLDVWLAKGGEVDPIDDRRHALSDAVALLGVRDAAHPWSGVASDAMTLGHDGSGPRAEFKAGSIVLDGGTKEIARKGDRSKAATAMATWMGQVESAINTLAPGSVAPLSTFPVTGAAASLALLDEGAARVKA
jgi:hypothetical protein